MTYMMLEVQCHHIFFHTDKRECVCVHARHVNNFLMPCAGMPRILIMLVVVGVVSCSSLSLCWERVWPTDTEHFVMSAPDSLWNVCDFQFMIIIKCRHVYIFYWKSLTSQTSLKWIACLGWWIVSMNIYRKTLCSQCPSQ